MKKQVAGILCAFLLTIGSAGLAFATSYSFIDLGIGTAYGINNSQQVVGSFGVWSQTSGYTSISSLGTGLSSLYDINDSMVLSGTTWDSTTSSNKGGYWSLSERTNYIGSLSTSNPHSYANGINNSNTIVGNTYDSNWGDTWVPFIWTESSGMQNLWGQGIYLTYANGINDFGNIAGAAFFSDGGPTGYLHSSIWNGSSLTKINVSSAISYGTYRDFATDINNNGAAVGYIFETSAPYSKDSYYWDASGGVINLRDLASISSEWTSLTAMGINDNYDIVGYGTKNGQTSAFLIAAQPVPEPATMILFGTGIAGLAGTKIRRKKKY